MRPAMVHESLLEERRQLGHDRFDEVWDGVLHMVPFPTTRHQRVERELIVAFDTIAKQRGLEAFGRTGLYDPQISDDSDYRGPDVMVTEQKYISRRGVEGHALLLIEVLSPGDESSDKLPFFARIGVREVWLLDPWRSTLEVHVLRDGSYERGSPTVLPLTASIAGSTLTIVDGQRCHTIELDDAF